MDNIFHPDRGIVKDTGKAGNQFSRDNCDIRSRGIMFLGICKSAAVLKLCMYHAKFSGFFIHSFDKFFLASRKMFCHYHGCIIPRCNYDTFDQGLHCLFFSLFQKNLRSPHTFCIGTGYRLFLQRDLSVFQCFKNQKQSHDFGNACRTSLFFSVFFV